VVLFGAVGAALSVAQSLIVLGAKIPAQQIGAFVLWVRPAIGAAAALVVLALLRANDGLHLFGAGVSDEPAIVGVLALFAGYSEHFIVGTLACLSRRALRALVICRGVIPFSAAFVQEWSVMVNARPSRNRVDCRYLPHWGPHPSPLP
jgi:hypothetical protein